VLNCAKAYRTDSSREGAGGETHTHTHTPDYSQGDRTLAF